MAAPGTDAGQSWAGEISLYEPLASVIRSWNLESDQEVTMTGLVSMIVDSWGNPEKAAIEALVVGIIATLATDLWLWLLQIVGFPPRQLGTGRSVAGMDAARRVPAAAGRCDAFDSRRTRDRMGLSL